MFLLVALFSAGWVGVAGSVQPEHLPITEIRLAPPKVPIPQVQAEIGQLEKVRGQLETDMVSQLEKAYSQTLETARFKIKQLVAVSTPALFRAHILARSRGGRPMSLVESHRRSSQEADDDVSSVKVNVLPVASPDPSIKMKLEAIEDKRSSEEQFLFKQACEEMHGLSNIFLQELGSQLEQQAHLVHAAVFQHSRAGGFLESGAKRVSASLAGLPKQVNVRVGAAAPYPRIAEKAQEMEERRDAQESQERSRILEMELKLIQAHNDIATQELRSAIDGIVAQRT